MFNEAYALEKIHGTSAHIAFDPNDNSISFFSGGEKHERFVKLFDEAKLLEGFLKLGITDRVVTVFGEAYGGSQQGMSATYGKELRFIAFDVKIGETWLNVPSAETIVVGLGLEFVAYEKIKLVKCSDNQTDPMGPDFKAVVVNMEEINRQRDLPSRQAKRNGILEDKIQEGVVLRPLNEYTGNNGHRIICKHKRDEFRETATPRVVDDPEKLKVLAEADAVANEWVTLERLKHVLDKIPEHGMEKMPDILKAITRSQMKAVTPKEAEASKHSSIPREVISACNELIIDALTDGQAVVKQKDIVKLALSKLNKPEDEDPYNAQYLYDHHWLDIEPVFRKAGWKVVYDKPAYNETYDATFTFSKKRA